MATNPILALTSVGTHAVAQSLADILVTAHLAACVSILGPIQSTYHWKGAVERGEEFQLVIKTTTANIHLIEMRLKEFHAALPDGYELPELMAIPITGGSSAYLLWLAENSQRR